MITAVNGSSHRRGKTGTLLSWVLAGSASTGAETRLVHVLDYSIQPCQGCLSCLKNGSCCIRDGFQPLRDLLLESGGIVIGSPSYSGQPPAQLKAFLDRLTLLNLYTLPFWNKASAAAATSGFAPCGGLAKSLAPLFGRPVGRVSAVLGSVQSGLETLTREGYPGVYQRSYHLGIRLAGVIQSPPALRLPPHEYITISLLHRFYLRRQVADNPQMFAGVLDIWRQKSGASKRPS